MPFGDLHPDGATVFEDQATRETFVQSQIGPLQGGLEIGIGCRPASPVPDGLLHRRKPFLLRTVIVFGDFEPRLAACLHKSLMQRNIAFTAADMQRPALAAPIGIAALAALVPIFHAQKIGQHICIGPAFGATFRPMVIITRMATHIDHAIYRRGATNHLAAGAGQLPPAQMRLWFRAIAPIIDGHIHWIGERTGHLDEGPGVTASIFENDHGMLTILRQPGRHG